jgi:iron complex outermembrane receptor protein
MRTRALSWAGLFLLVLVAAAPLAAQEATVITGRVVSLEDGQALGGATVAIPALGLTATTDAGGRYSITVSAELAKGKAVEVRADFGELLTSIERVVLRPGSIQQDFAIATSYFETITVGSRATGAAAVAKAVPVELLSHEKLATSGASETNQIIQALAPSFNFPRPTITDGTDSVRPATLRGLGSDQVLVLLNGKRRHTSALVHVNGSIGRGSTGVDLNAVPASAIESIEILKDGAAAQYGSDAIAGVINLTLKSGAEAWGVDLKSGATTHGDGQLLDASVHKGWSLGRGWLFATAEYRDREATNRAGPDPNPQGSRDPVSQPTFHWGDAEVSDVMGFFNAQFPLGAQGDTWFYSFGGLSERNGSHAGFFRRANQATNQPSIYPNGFLPLIEPKVTDSSFTAGARGVAGGWFWDLSTQYGDNQFEFNVADSLNASLGPNIPPNQTEFYAGTLGLDQLVANLDLVREFEIGMSGPLNVAVGAELRREGYQIEAGEPASYVHGGFPTQFGGIAAPGAQVFPGFRPSNEVDVSRDSYAAYVDLEGDIASRLRLGFAGRFEDYDDFGSTSDYKLTARLQLVPEFVVRGAVSTGFRAPSLGQSYFSTVSTNFLAVGGVLLPFEVGTFPIGSPVGRALGAPALKPEESDHLSAGMVWNPTSAFEVAADYYAIDISDRIVLSGNFTGPSVAAILAPFNATGARFFTNAIDTETRGYDLRMSYTMPLGSGTLDLSAGYNDTANKVVRVRPTPGPLAGLQEVLFDATERRRVECGQPKDNLRLSADWDPGKSFIQLRASRYGEYCLVDRRVVPQDFAPEWVADLELGYRFPQFTVAVGAQNLTDAFPDRHLLPNSNLGIFTYPSSSPFGMNGRFVYARLGVTF